MSWKPACTEERIKDRSNLDLNNSLKASIEKYIKNEDIVRYYTLNYDKLPIFACGINFFEGFNQDSTFDLNRVLTDFSVNCYYNLHGSLYYKQEGFNNLTLTDSPQEIYSTGNNITQEGDTSLCSNIITGLKKSSLILNQPHFSFYNSLIYDYMNADEIHFIGYSFGDIHINKVFDYPSKAEEIIVVDYIHDYKDLTEDFFPFYENNQVHRFLGGRATVRNIGDALKSKMLHKTKVYVKGYKSYLQGQIKNE